MACDGGANARSYERNCRAIYSLMSLQESVKARQRRTRSNWRRSKPHVRIGTTVCEAQGRAWRTVDGRLLGSGQRSCTSDGGRVKIEEQGKEN